MLPISLIASWFRTSATSEIFKAALDEYVEGATVERYETDIQVIHWRENTVFTFEDNEWSKNEGSLLFDNRRAVIWKKVDDHNSHLIFLSLFASSLAHLTRSVTQIFETSYGVEVQPLEFKLGKGLVKCAPYVLAGAELTNFHNDKLVFQGGILPPNEDFFDHLEDDDIEFFRQHPHKFYLSKLYLRLGELMTETILSREGLLILNDPDLSLAEVVGIIYDVEDVISESERSRSA
ncbi:MAG TPA: hypothetical protein VI306_26135 [Pyrinomonadaceae bacterium]